MLSREAEIQQHGSFEVKVSLGVMRLEGRPLVFLLVENRGAKKLAKSRGLLYHWRNGALLNRFTAANTTKGAFQVNTARRVLRSCCALFRDMSDVRDI